MVRSSLRNGVLVFFVCCCLQGFSTPDVREENPLPMEQLKAFAETYWQIKQLYVDEVDDKKLLEGAINGMLQSLDPYSGYLNEEDLIDLQASSDGYYDGLGVEVVAKQEQVMVVNTLEDSPAQRAGIRINDIITRVNQKDVSTTGAQQAIDAMRGKAGEAIQLTIVREGASAPIDLQLTRETLEVKSVRVKSLENDLLHVKISMFQRDTGYELARMLRKQMQHDPVEGVIIDLRNNPGGVLRAAVDVADLALPEGIIVSTEGRTSDNQQRFFANPGDELEHIPLVVLINERSASASEIVAGALQDHQRATILGKKSYGKGVVQSILPLQANSAIKLTTSRYYTPKGRSIHGEGVIPDIELAEADTSTSSQNTEDVALARAIHLLELQSQSKLSANQ